MPRYCYFCPSCGHKQEVQKKANEPDPTCEKCGSDLNRDYPAEGGAAPHFKGSGFYETDYK